MFRQLKTILRVLRCEIRDIVFDLRNLIKHSCVMTYKRCPPHWPKFMTAKKTLLIAIALLSCVTVLSSCDRSSQSTIESTDATPPTSAANKSLPESENGSRSTKPNQMLHDAVIDNELKQVQRLVEEKGVDPNQVFDPVFNDSMLVTAITLGHQEIAEYLMNKADEPTLDEALVVTACYGLPNYTQLLIDAGADVNATTPDGATALSEAQNEECRSLNATSDPEANHDTVVDMLKEAGAR